MTPSEPRGAHARRRPHRSGILGYASTAVILLAVAGTATAAAGTPARVPAAVPRGDGNQAAVTRGWGEPADGDEFRGTAVDAHDWTRYGDGRGRDRTGRDGDAAHPQTRITVAHGRLTVHGDAHGGTAGLAWKKGLRHGRWEVRMRVRQRHCGARPYRPLLALRAGSDTRTGDREPEPAAGTGRTGPRAYLLHYADGTANGGHGPATYDTRAKPLDTSRWHDYAVEWAGDHVAGYIDGRRWFLDTARKRTARKRTARKPRAPLHPALGLVAPSSRAGLNPASLEVDWARVYGG